MQTARLLQQENNLLRQIIDEKDHVLAEKNQQTEQQKIFLLQQSNLIDEQKNLIKKKNDYIAHLEEWIKLQRQKKFGASSEKVPASQLDLFNEAEVIVEETVCDEEDSIAVPSHTRRKKPRVSIPADLPREEIIYDISDKEKVCPHDGTELRAIGSEDHEQLDIIPAQMKAIVHKRLKYACPCCEQHVAIAAKPKQPIEKSIASPGLLAFVATQKYCDALPLYRQSEIFQRIGIRLDRANLANWMIQCGQLIQPLMNLLQEHLLERTLVHMDETTLQVLNEPGKTPQSKSYLWLRASFSERPIILYHYDPTRSQTVPLELLNDSVQALMVDGYQGYQRACDEYGITRLGCWQHARSKFVAVTKIQAKGKTGKAHQALAYIQKLYQIERCIKDEPPDKRRDVRQQDAKPILDQLQTWLQKSLPHVPPKTVLGDALQYLHLQWDRLIRYVDNGLYPIDNNSGENQMRPFVVGRKNWLFANSQAGAKASANLYSLIQTAKANQLNPYEYLKHVFKALPNANTVEDIENLLPWKVTKTISHS